MAAATIAAQRGHQVTLFEADNKIGGQFNIAKQIPGKEEFHETLRYFKKQLALHQVNLQLETRVTKTDLHHSDFEEIIIATGIKPRTPHIDGIDHKKVLSYLDVLKYKKPVGQKVAIIGAGGIGFDLSEYLLHEGNSNSIDLDNWLKEWGIDKNIEARGGIAGVKPVFQSSKRTIFILKRSKGKFGKNLGKTTGWIHRSNLKKKGVQFINEVQYSKVDDQGLHYIQYGKSKVLDVDTIVICAGQTPLRPLYSALKNSDKSVHVIGGADVASELDAKRAIDQGCRLASKL